MKRRTKGKRRVVIESGKVGHDVIIAGGSFAGLAVASQIHGRNLLIEPNGIGEYPTSACGTLLGVPERLGLTKGYCRFPGCSPFTPAQARRSWTYRKPPSVRLIAKPFVREWQRPFEEISYAPGFFV